MPRALNYIVACLQKVGLFGYFYTPVEDGSYYPSFGPLTFRVRSVNPVPFKIFS